MLAIINGYRRSRGLSAVQWNDAIHSESYKHTVRMANGQIGMGHAGFRQRLDNFNCGGGVENVASGNSDPNAVVN